MLLSTTFHQIFPLLLLFAIRATLASSYTAQIQLKTDPFSDPIVQHCIHIPPGICCRWLNLPGAPTRFHTFHAASFMNMQSRDLALVWTPDRPAPGQAGYAAGDPVPSAAGCGGRVLASRIMHSDTLRLSFPTELNANTGASPGLITGASYVSLPPQSDTGYDGIVGMRAVLGGGGRMFGAKNQTGVAAYPYHMVSRRNDVVKDAEGPPQWIWPDRVTVNGTEFAQVGGHENLVYQSGFGDVLDLGPYNLHSGRVSDR